MKTWMKILALPLLLGLVSCKEEAVKIDLNPDGSGVVHIRQYANAQAAAAFGGEVPSAEEQVKSLEATVKGIGSSMDGLTFVEGKATSNARGWPGYIVTYSFSDINDLALSLDSKTEMTDEDGFTMTTEEESMAPKYTFSYEGGKLEIMTKVTPNEQAEGPGADDQAEQMLAMMKPQLVGMRTSVILEVKGTVTESDAPFVGGADRNKFMLFDLQFDKALDDPAFLKMMKEHPEGMPAKKLHTPYAKIPNSDKKITIQIQ